MSLKKIFIVLLIIQIGFSLLFAFYRYIDADEGLYLSAANQIKVGKLPYQDFFYSQVSSFPFIYFPFSGLKGLFEGRILSLFFSLILGILIYRFCYQFFKNRKIALLIFFLYIVNGLLLSWHSTFKPYALTDLASFLAFGFLSKNFFEKFFFAKKQAFFLAGFFISLAANTRLIFITVWLLLLIILFFYQRASIPERLKTIVFFISGSLVPSLLSIFLFFKDPSTFWFDNLGYHLLWGKEIIKQPFLVKIYTLAKFVFYPQNLLLIVLAVISLFSLWKNYLKIKVLTPESKVILSALGFAILIKTSYFIATPTLLQYYSQTLPYLLILSAPALNHLQARINYLTQIKRKLIISGLLIFYSVTLIPYLSIFIFISREKDQPFKTSQIKKVVEIIQHYTQNQDLVLSAWPGYAVLAERKVVPGFETCGYEITPYLKKEQIQKFKLLSKNDLRELIFNQKVKLIVLPDDRLDDLLSLIEEKYTKQEIGGVKIYIRNE